MLVAWIGLTVICLAKGKVTFALTNLFIGPGVLGLIGSLRLAKPNSWWYWKLYDTDKRGRADARFSKIRERGLRPAGLSPGDRPMWKCSLCGDLFLDDETAERHADAGHVDVSFLDSKAAMVRLPVAVPNR